jgi:vitamin B12/bleomycin/antimicrobial peptide transport system ATP-binding/permease protein
VQASPYVDAVPLTAKRSLRRAILVRLLGAIRAVVMSEIGGKFRLMFATILLLLLGISGLNVVSSYVGRDLMTAIEQRSHARFATMAALYVAVFAALTVAAVLLRFVEERLALLWRDWLTRGLVRQYLADGAYLRLRESGELGNPDQRIADDARSFAASTLSFVLIFINAGFAIVAFSGVMWSISPLLFAVAAAYAALGSLFTVVLGRPLVRLNYNQSDREASFRSELVHLGANAESVALLQLEGRLGERLGRRIDALVANARRIIAVNRNLSFFTNGYAYGIQLLPPLIVGPLFMRGSVDFGVITQSAMAFSHLLGAFSLIVTQIQQLSSYAAVLVRLDRLTTAVEGVMALARPPTQSTEGPEQLRYDDLTLRSPSDGQVLVAHLTMTIPTGTRVLITGTDEARRVLFRATALGRDAPQGCIVRPAPERILFLPERPHVPPGTVRELLVRTGHEQHVTDEMVHGVLEQLGLEPALKRVGGLDAEGDWGHSLSLGEQQLLAFGRVLLAAPAFVVIQSPGTTLAPEQLARALHLLSEAHITYLVFGAVAGYTGDYDAVLELHAGGTWDLRRPPRVSDSFAAP